MPEIEITPEQEERLRALQEDIARDVVGKYGHVRPRDAVEYLLDRYEEDEDADPGDATVETTETDDEDSATETDDGDSATETDDEDSATETDDGDSATETDDGDSATETDDDGGDTAHVVDEGGDGTDGAATTGGDDAMLNEMMSLLDTHDDKWGESGGDERYEVELPDGTAEQVRTKDDVKALLFKHYR
ncbi:hypothetical protein [Haloplanus pelagicus]|uniref:hypothetical protein n=1 Tax=Haloplanus pelagicus TaxID=2949995 RepID=UPI002041F42C|nr:hypothetical protein [Haloplanus sp. HW8-1]